MEQQYNCLSALEELARLRQLRSLFLWLDFKPTECESANLFKALNKIVEAKGNVLENLFVDWWGNQGSEVDQHFLFKVLANCKKFRRIGYPCKFVGGREGGGDAGGRPVPGRPRPRLHKSY